MLWFGDDGSNLHAVNGQDMTALPNMPLAPAPGGGHYHNPGAVHGRPGRSGGAPQRRNCSRSRPCWCSTRSASNIVSVPTQGTNLISLSTTVTNGVLYAGGGQVNSGKRERTFSAGVWHPCRPGGAGAARLHRRLAADAGLRRPVAAHAQPERRGALPDPSDAGRRHQGAAGEHESVKLWADQANTIVLVNGQSYTLGPDDDQFASVKTSSSGQLVIVSGYTQADGSDATDMNAVPLRAWASFMNPYERMLVFRDQEFHNRVATAHATDPSQAGADDPTRANLQTAQTYGDPRTRAKAPATHCSPTQQKQHNQPQQVANAIQTMTGSVGTAPPSGSKTLQGVLQPACHRHARASYIAYTDTPGAQYSPVNVAAEPRRRRAPDDGGSATRSNNDGTCAAAFSTLIAGRSHAGHRRAGWPGLATSRTHRRTSRRRPPASRGRRCTCGRLLGRLLGLAQGRGGDHHARHRQRGGGHLRSASASSSTGSRTSSRRSSPASSRRLNAIGAFFVELGHLIEEIIEALSVLFQFGHIIDTHNILKAELLKRINGDGTASLPGPRRPGDGSTLGHARAPSPRWTRSSSRASRPSTTSSIAWPTR